MFDINWDGLAGTHTGGGRNPGTNLFDHYQWRDVRTMIDCLMNGGGNGYCNIDSSRTDFNSAVVVKHDPVQDCAFDIMMMRYGK